MVFGDEIGELEEEIILAGGEVIHIPEPKNNYFSYMRNLQRVMKECGPFNIVHSHTLFNSGYVMKAAYKSNIPIRISHSHSCRFGVNLNLQRKIYEKIMRKLLNKYSTNILACSSVAGEYLFGKEDFIAKGKVIPNAIELSHYDFDYKKRLEVRKKYDLEGKLVLGHTGNFNWVKNHIFLIEIFFEVLKVNSSSILLLVGDGKERLKIEKFAEEKGILDKVVFVGAKSNVRDFLMAMDIFIFPSLYEGLGLSLVEAQVAQLPCVVSDSIPEEAIISDSTIKKSLDEDLKSWVDGIFKLSTLDRREIKPLKDIYRLDKMITSINKVYDSGGSK